MTTTTAPVDRADPGHPCPAWCTEHYSADDGTYNHAGSTLRGVVGESATSGDPMELHVWPELRVVADNSDAYPVGVLELSKFRIGQVADQFELTGEQLRRLARHLVAVAAELDTAAAAVRDR